MADEVPGEDVQEGKGEIEIDEIPGEEQFLGEGEDRPSTAETLASDFCKPEREYEEEELGEALWVCEQQEAEEEYYEGWGDRLQEGLGEGEGEDMEELGVADQRSLDSEYLKAVLGTPLTFALLDIANKRPTDPIQYLGSYLLKWRWTTGNKADYEKQMKELNEQRGAYQEQMRERERQMMLEGAQRDEELRTGVREESSVENEEEFMGEGQNVEVGG